MERWNGKVALVTGASAGIGAAIVEELARNGMKVVGMARRVEKIEELKKRLGHVDGEVHALKGDISKESDILSAFKWIKNRFGVIHVLINNAGVARQNLLLEAPTNHFRDVFDVNVLGLTICTQQAYKLMKEADVWFGHIIHINSVVGHYVPNMGKPLFNVYAASKHAVTALNETLRQELNSLKSRVKVTSISPGVVKSEFFEASSTTPADGSEAVDKQFETLPGLEPQDIADTVLYVLSTPPKVQVHDIIIRPVGEAF